MLQSIQIAYETQRPELVERLANQVFMKTNILEVSKTLLTAIDMNAITFMLNVARQITKLRYLVILYFIYHRLPEFYIL